MGLLSSLLTRCRPFLIMDGPGMERQSGDNVPAEDPGPESIGDDVFTLEGHEDDLPS